MRVAVYARVSTERQEQQGTIASQLDALRRFAREHSYEVVDAYVCVNDGYSGGRLDRPGLDRLRDGAEASAFEAVLVLCPDRLARKYAYQVLILEELERFGIRVIFLEQPPSEDPNARLLVQIQGAIAEYERMKITERYRRGKLFRARQGEVIFWKVAYGYRRVPRRDGVPAHVEISEPEAHVVRQIFAWHVHDRLSVRQIALRLTESARLSATGLTRWGTSTVTRMLRNEAYIGTMYFNRHESLEGEPATTGRRRRTKSRTRCRPATEWIPMSVPPLISEELFRCSQALHAANSRFSPRHLKSGHYLLRGLVRCRACDLGVSCHRMRGRNGTVHHYYYCAGHDVLRARRRVGRCPQRNLRADALDELVWDEVRRHLESPALIMEAYTTLHAEPAPRSTSSSPKRSGRSRRRWPSSNARSTDCSMPTRPG
jgi:site-specific DNA recombinase